MAIPGGQAIALPLAICAVVSKALLGGKTRQAAQEVQSTETILHKLLQQIVTLQMDIRRQFTHLYELLENQHKNLIIILDQGFSCLATYTLYYNLQINNNILGLDNKLDCMLFNISKEFSDLYLEYIRDPIDEIQFFDRYGQGDVHRLQANKLKLSMWLLFKSKHQKVNGRDLIAYCENTADISAYFSLVLNKILDRDAVLGMVNRYVNLEFGQQFPEEVPHLPSWLLAADKYILLLRDHSDYLQNVDNEPQIINDIISVGEQVLNFVDQLAINEQFWHKISEAYQAQSTIIQNEIASILDANNIDAYLNEPTLCRQAKSAPLHEQLEQFDTININIMDNWERYIVQHLPQEIFIAEGYGLGKLEFNFSIDPEVNNFAHVRMAYSNHLLPNHGRDVLYKLEVHFKSETQLHAQHLLTAWFAYDLCTPIKRFNEYYNLKFQYGLRHTQYLWVSLNGLRNQVDGHGETDTRKLIDHSRLALIYKNWWPQTVPVNEPTVLERVKQNPTFYAKYTAMLDQGQCVSLQPYNIEALKIYLQNEINEKLFKQQLKISNLLQSSKVIPQALGKLDAYNSVLAVFSRILSLEFNQAPIAPKYYGLLSSMLKPATVNIDYKTQLKAIYPSILEINRAGNYRAGPFYQRLRHTITRLQLLINTMAPTVRLRG